VRKVLLLLALFLALAATSAAAGNTSPNGVFRPTLSTSPKSYLKHFPLNLATTDEVIQYVGTPDKSFSLSGSDYLTINIEPKGGSGVIEYTFEIKDGTVVNVTYLNSGNFFGVTQRESARQLQAP
jgi:hypothetical protein